jgi:hypothetical protein
VHEPPAGGNAQCDGVVPMDLEAAGHGDEAERDVGGEGHVGPVRAGRRAGSQLRQ